MRKKTNITKSENLNLATGIGKRKNIIQVFSRQGKGNTKQEKKELEGLDLNFESKKEGGVTQSVKTVTMAVQC